MKKILLLSIAFLVLALCFFWARYPRQSLGKSRSAGLDSAQRQLGGVPQSENQNPTDIEAAQGKNESSSVPHLGEEKVGEILNSATREIPASIGEPPQYGEALETPAKELMDGVLISPDGYAVLYYYYNRTRDKVDFALGDRTTGGITPLQVPAYLRGEGNIQAVWTLEKGKFAALSFIYENKESTKGVAYMDICDIPSEKVQRYQLPLKHPHVSLAGVLGHEVIIVADSSVLGVSIHDGSVRTLKTISFPKESDTNVEYSASCFQVRPGTYDLYFVLTRTIVEPVYKHQKSICYLSLRTANASYEPVALPADAPSPYSFAWNQQGVLAVSAAKTGGMWIFDSKTKKSKWRPSGKQLEINSFVGNELIFTGAAPEIGVVFPSDIAGGRKVYKIPYRLSNADVF